MTESKPNKYNHSKLYKLQCDDGYFYIGSTTNSLPKRLGNHKDDSKKRIDSKLYSHINEIGWDNVKIILISEHILENKEQLLRSEDELITKYKDDPFCLNIKRAIIELNKSEYKKEWYDSNKNRILEDRKEYRKNNIDKINKYKKNNEESIKRREKIYKEKNKDKINDNFKKYYENTLKTPHICICGSEITIGSKSRHFRTKKHINYLSQVACSDTTEPIDNTNMVNQDVSPCTLECLL